MKKYVAEMIGTMVLVLMGLLPEQKSVFWGLLSLSVCLW